jgi:hypothetical protein
MGGNFAAHFFVKSLTFRYPKSRRKLYLKSPTLLH